MLFTSENRLPSQFNNLNIMTTFKNKWRHNKTDEIITRVEAVRTHEIHEKPKEIHEIYKVVDDIIKFKDDNSVYPETDYSITRVNMLSRREHPVTILQSSLIYKQRTIEKPNVHIYVLCYDDKHFSYATAILGRYYWAVPIRIKYQVPMSEDAVWRQLSEIEDEWKNCEMVGTMSINIFKILKLGDIDRIIRRRNMWTSGFYHFVDTGTTLLKKMHPHIITSIDDIIAQLCLPQPASKLYNNWMCTPEKMRYFIQKIESLEPNIIENPPRIEESECPEEVAMQQSHTISGVTDYPHVPGVLEKIKNTSFTTNPINAKISCPNVRIYVLCHNEERFAMARERYAKYYWAVPIMMKYQDVTFENAFWKQLGEIEEEWRDYEMVGTISSIAYTKIDINTMDTIIKTPEKWSGGYYNFKDTLNHIGNPHPHFNTIATDVLSQLGMPMPTDNHCNYWMCTPDLMLKFIEWEETLFKPLILKHSLSMTDANYGLHERKLTNAECVQKFGVPYYPHVPFVMERLNKSFFMRQSSTTKEYESKLYIIGGVTRGGSVKFIKDFIRFFPATRVIKSAEELLRIEFGVLDILFIQQLFFTDITSTHICEIESKYRPKVIINVHDYTWFNWRDPHRIYLDKPSMPTDNRELFLRATCVVHPSRFTWDNYATQVPDTNFILSAHIDYDSVTKPLYIPLITHNLINIGVLHEFSEYKGCELIQMLQHEVRSYKGYTIKFLITGVNIPRYDEDTFFEHIKLYNIHGLLALNKWGETYSYALTKYLLSGLPILYNSFGSFKERIPAEDRYICALDNETEYLHDNSKVVSSFSRFLDFILSNNGVGEPPSCQQRDFNIPLLYRFLAQNYNNNALWDNIHRKMLPIARYFPQFHRIKENDMNYYEGMTDMENMKSFVVYRNKDNIDTPNLKMLQLQSLSEYDLTNKELVDRQVDIAKSVGIYGFAVYYYWFTTNSITGKNVLMETAYDNFFKQPYDKFKVYFDWANEDWTKNPAFGNTATTTITNTYDPTSFDANISNVVSYFKHENYLKINNKPVFSIHHPWLLPASSLSLLHEKLTIACQNVGFDGIELLINSMVDNSYGTATYFNHRPNYKKYNMNVSGYRDIMFDGLATEHIQTLAYSFDNSVRMSNPDKPMHVVKIKDITTIAQNEVTQHYISAYRSNRNSANKILLINAWNEWGENMAIEPGFIKGTYYSDMIRLNSIQLLTGKEQQTNT